MIDVHEVYPYLRVHNADEAIKFYARAFGARELLEDVSTAEMQRRYSALFGK